MKKRINKQFQGSKRAGRRRAIIIRDMKYLVAEERQKIIDAPDSSIEEVAEAMGIKLR